jgi:hypothetical protein
VISLFIWFFLWFIAIEEKDMQSGLKIDRNGPNKLELILRSVSHSFSNFATINGPVEDSLLDFLLSISIEISLFERVE